MSSLIRLENVSRHYGAGERRVTVLQDISFRLSAGETVAITGSSGSGKSTLMNLIGLLDRPSSGRYFLAGKEVSSLPTSLLATFRNQKIGFVFQAFYLLPRLSVLQNVMLPLQYRREPSLSARNKAIAVLAQTGMQNYLHALPQTLSGGQQQRVAIARALVGEPEILLADEPTGALDSCNSRRVMDLLFSLNTKRNSTLLVITHDEEIRARFPRHLILRDGRLLESNA